MDGSELLSLVYSINFQIRQIWATNHQFSCEKSKLVWVKITPGIDFVDGAVVQCYVLVVKVLL